jgi:O-antigen ligase
MVKPDMNWRPQPLTLACRIGLLASLVLIGILLLARQRVLLQSTATDYTPLSGEAEWQGDWKFSELGADPSETGSQAGIDRAIIPFVGTDLALHVRRGNYRGNFFVSIDGQPADQLPREERGAYLVLTSPDCTPQVALIPVASSLSDGPHEALVVADRGWDQWPLVGWRVSRTPDTTVYRWAITGLGALGLVCLGGVIWEAGGARKQGNKETSRKREATRHSPFAIRYSPFAVRHAPFVILITAAVFYFSPWLPLTLISGLALAVLICLRLDLGLALVAATAPFYMHPRPLFGKAFSMAEITTLLCVASWGTKQIIEWQTKTRNTGHKNYPASAIDLAALCFVCIAIASTLAADYRHVALRELRVVVLEPALFYLMLHTSHLNDKAIWRIVDFFVLGGVVVAVIGLAQFGLGANIITAEEGFRRLRSVYGSPNNTGLYLGRVLPVLAAVALFGAARRRRIAYGLAVLPVGLAVLFSFSKGALILGVPLSLLALGVLAGGPWLWASLGVVAAASAAALPLLRTPRFAPLFDTRSGSTFFRLQLWRSSWMMFRDHLWLGVGPDNFLYQYRGRYILPAAWQEPHLSHPHNILLDYSCRLGLGGLAAGVWLQVAFWRLALPLRRLTDRDQRALALGLMGSMVNFLTHGLVDASYFVIDLAFAFFLTLCVVQWLASIKGETDELEI